MAYVEYLSFVDRNSHFLSRRRGLANTEVVPRRIRGCEMGLTGCPLRYSCVYLPLLPYSLSPSSKALYLP